MKKTRAELLQISLAETYKTLSVSMWRPNPKGDILYTFTNSMSNALLVTLREDMSLKSVAYQQNRYGMEKPVNATREMLPDELREVFDGIYKRENARTPEPVREISRENTKQFKSETADYGIGKGKETYEYEY